MVAPPCRYEVFLPTICASDATARCKRRRENASLRHGGVITFGITSASPQHKLFDCVLAFARTPLKMTSLKIFLDATTGR